MKKIEVDVEGLKAIVAAAIMLAVMFWVLGLIVGG